MSDEHPEHQPPSVAPSTAESALRSASSSSNQDTISIYANQKPHSPQKSAPAISLAPSAVVSSSTAPKESAERFRRLSDGSEVDMQLDSNQQYSVSAGEYSGSHLSNPQERMSDRERLIGGLAAAGAKEKEPHGTSDDSESLLHSLSSTSLSRQAQFTFSMPSQNNAAVAVRADPAGSKHSVSRSPSFAAETLLIQSTRGAEQFHGTPSLAEEDIRMSESPHPDEVSSLKDTDSPSLRRGSVDYGEREQFRRPSTPSAHHYHAQRPYDQRSSTHPSQSATPPADSDHREVSSSRQGSEGATPRSPEGVTMPARSAVLYHAGYNSGRGAVWRFFRVVEARVSGNTDRAECLLCYKRMLGKSADMKKHIVSNCPNRNDIAEDMKPILQIVKSELENPKKRAKRNSNTPITLRSDGSFAPVTPTYSTTHAEHAPITARLLPTATHQSPTVSRAPTHQRPGTYDFHPSHPDAHRVKMAKYSREYMHGGAGGSQYEGTGGGPDHPGHYPHGTSAIPMPPPGHQPRQPIMQPNMGPRLRSPVSGYPHRHPMGPPMQHPPQSQPQLAPTQPQLAQPQPQLAPTQQQHQQQQQQSGPPHVPHHPSRQTPGPPLQPHQQPVLPPPQSQQAPPGHTRYYPPGPGSQVPLQHGVTQRQSASHSSHHIPHSQRTSPSGSPHISGSNRLLNRLKSKLQRRIPVFGVWLTIPSPVTARVMAAQGFDWACIDMEHTPTNPALMAEMVAAVAGSGTCAPIVRVPSHAPEWFKWALDAGAHGIIVPTVNTAEEMRDIERMCRYPPTGKRSMGAFFAPNAFGLRGPRAVNDYVEHVSNDILVIPQIESVEGAANLPSILKAGGMDAIFVGPYDLNASVRASHDMQIQDVMVHIEQSAKDSDVPLGIYASSGAAAGSRHREGYTLLVAASDIECLSSSAADNLDRARSETRHYR
ncbi:hypothetical protein IW147_002318 [Coemansia sp. RSA 720]|nr:hypothetical protein IW147_002318 [Coemansia sp. RSA 720]KAJ2544949.1 hypothetical protein GGF49_000859 [Coemansia sp. RSA 1853]